jgi:ribonuclease HII
VSGRSLRLFKLGQPIAGIDEAGRGPLAGPVVAAAVILPDGSDIDGLDDSKKLTAERREALVPEIRRRAICWSVAAVDVAELDSINILNASLLAMRRAILRLPRWPASVLVDGNRLPNLEFFGRRVDGDAVVGGDGLVASISAASVLAKVHRDALMRRADDIFPGYGFAAHKGYATRRHLDALARLGPCDLHRQSFRPMREPAPGEALEQLRPESG